MTSSTFCGEDHHPDYPHICAYWDYLNRRYGPQDSLATAVAEDDHDDL